ncbi:MAG: serine acetyltransferase, partial [Clostridia bacterium]|nr:serine acetyltransferase [Clostridia bacterium]
KTPVLGSNVELGYGAVIIGDVNVADNTVIGANAVVNRSIEESGTYVGVPAKKVMH